MNEISQELGGDSRLLPGALVTLSLSHEQLCQERRLQPVGAQGAGQTPPAHSQLDL